MPVNRFDKFVVPRHGSFSGMHALPSIKYAIHFLQCCKILYRKLYTPVSGDILSCIVIRVTLHIQVDEILVLHQR